VLRQFGSKVIHRMSQPTAFIIMPFAEQFEDLWHFGIRETLAGLGFVCVRADQITSPGFIVSQVYDQILSADLIVAEMTGRNPNVFYEVGWAHALGKPTILCASKGEEISAFDTLPYRHVLHNGQAYILRERLNAIVPQLLIEPPPLPPDAKLLWAWPSAEHEPPLLEWRADPKRCGGRKQLDVLGGQSIEPAESGHKVLRVHNTITNWNHKPEWSIIRIVNKSSALKLGDEVTVSLMVRADTEAVIMSSGDGKKLAPDGSKVWAKGFTDAERRVSSPLWRWIFFSSIVEPCNDGQDPTALGGVSAYIRFRTNGSIWIRQINLYSRGMLGE
jgi:hypothetical protein